MSCDVVRVTRSRYRLESALRLGGLLREELTNHSTKMQKTVLRRAMCDALETHLYSSPEMMFILQNERCRGKAPIMDHFFSFAVFSEIKSFYHSIFPVE